MRTTPSSSQGDRGRPTTTKTATSASTEAAFSTPTQRTHSGGLSAAGTISADASPFVLDYGDGDPQDCPASSNTSNNNSHSIKKNKDLAFAIAWSPLPPITWLIPFIGHTGIADSQGVVSDFRGPYYVGDDGRMAFGAPTRYLTIDNQQHTISAQQWDAAIQEANTEYRGRMHNICCDNCHSHVAYALNNMNVTAFGVQKWDMVKICFLVFVRGKFLSWGAVLKQFLPFALIVGLVVLIKRL